LPLDEKKLMDFMQKAVLDLGATISSSMVVIGEKLGLYKAMAGTGPITAIDLAKKTGIREQYVSAWLNNQAAGGYVVYDPKTSSVANWFLFLGLFLSPDIILILLVLPLLSTKICQNSFFV